MFPTLTGSNLTVSSITAPLKFLLVCLCVSCPSMLLHICSDTACTWKHLKARKAHSLIITACRSIFDCIFRLSCQAFIKLVIVVCSTFIIGRQIGGKTEAILATVSASPLG